MTQMMYSVNVATMEWRIERACLKFMLNFPLMNYGIKQIDWRFKTSQGVLTRKDKKTKQKQNKTKRNETITNCYSAMTLHLTFS